MPQRKPSEPAAQRPRLHGTGTSGLLPLLYKKKRRCLHKNNLIGKVYKKQRWLQDSPDLPPVRWLTVLPEHLADVRSRARGGGRGNQTQFFHVRSHTLIQ